MLVSLGCAEVSFYPYLFTKRILARDNASITSCLCVHCQYLKENGDKGHFTENYSGDTRDGRRINVGNYQTVKPGNEDTFMSYGLPWANASNTPFRLFKSFVHEGGIATPFVVHWPATVPSVQHNRNGDGNNCGRICHSPWIMMDIVATCLDIAGVRVAPGKTEGESFLPILRGEEVNRQKPIFWEHQGNCAVRDGKWKLVRRCSDDDAKVLRVEEHGNDCDHDLYGWELYNMDDDRTELHNLASEYRERAKCMAKEWSEWASRVGVKPWPLNPLPEGERDWSNVPWLW